MGQVKSQEPVQDSKPDVLWDVFCQGVVHASQRLKEYLGFEDPQNKLQPSTETLNEVFLVNFISYCVEKGVEEHITTSTMTRQQRLLFGVDWVWTILGPDKNVKIQFPVQTAQMSDQAVRREMQDLEKTCEDVGELARADSQFRKKSNYEKLDEFCSLVGKDCVGMFIVFGVPGKTREIRGALLESVKSRKGKNGLRGDLKVKDFFQTTDTFVSTREMLECCSKNNGVRDLSNSYINFL
ncbi:rab15 effector protein-like [Amia ocellicauda]|uniref:rab15 effector protein-like n=1 Tax=Amia ocellicauda TaxID=2972642 RepID=UPI0034648FDE|nr:REP15 protein [Amia calva]